MKQFRCNGCGELDTIVEVELVPRAHEIHPDTRQAVDGETVETFEYGDIDEVSWEASATLGYGCTNVDCGYWQGNYGDLRPMEQLAHAFSVMAAPDLATVATVIEV